MAIPHDARRRRPAVLSAELVLVIVGALGIIAAIIVALLNWQGA